MYDVDKRLRSLKMMQKRRVPEEYRHDGDTGIYRTEYERYNAIYEEINKCDDQELNNLEILLDCEMESSKRFREYSNIVPLVIPIFVLAFSVGSQFVTGMMQIAGQDAFVLKAGTELFSTIMVLMMIVSFVCIVVYACIELRGSKEINRQLYLSLILKKIKEDRKIKG